MRPLIFLAAALSAQTQFEVASVKPSAPDEHNSFMFQSLPGGTIRMAGVPLRMMIMEAYGIKAFQLSGGPDWIRTDRWDVLAKADGFQARIPREQENLMVQSMMADRFQLKIHKETREMSVYALEAGKSGSKLVPAGAERQFRSGNGTLSVKKGDMAALASWLSRQLGRVVMDKTELKGEFDYALEWTSEPGQGGPESIGLPPDTRGTPPVETTGPSIFTAVQEQLGLRLVSTKGPVEIIVIDRVEKPSSN